MAGGGSELGVVLRLRGTEPVRSVDCLDLYQEGRGYIIPSIRSDEVCVQRQLPEVCVCVCGSGVTQSTR